MGSIVNLKFPVYYYRIAIKVPYNHIRTGEYIADAPKKPEGDPPGFSESVFMYI